MHNKCKTATNRSCFGSPTMPETCNKETLDRDDWESEIRTDTVYRYKSTVKMYNA